MKRYTLPWVIAVVGFVLTTLGPTRGAEAFPANTSPRSPHDSDSYLLLVASADAAKFTPDKVQQFSKSPYDGVAVSFLTAYATEPVPATHDMEAKIFEWKKITNKDFWPWVFLNRMVGPDPTKDNPHASDPYFKRIRGIDLDDRTGSRKDFLQSWQNALHVAKETHSPGIVSDLEFYNNYPEYNLVELAKQTGKKPEEAIDSLRNLGAKMADVAASEYPDAKIWFLFTDIGNPAWKVVDGKPYYASPGYIVLGMLDQIKQSNAKLKVIDGGEVALGYCHTSIDQLNMKIANRDKYFAPVFKKYPGIFDVAAPLTLWSDASVKTSWMAQGFCGQSSAKSVEDLEPYLEVLMKTNKYVWIYASDKGGYDPFHPRVAPRFDRVLSQAKTRTSGS
jgi:hypothetical protein